MVKLYVKYNNNPTDNSEIVLGPDCATMSLQEILKYFNLNWPPDLLIMKVGKRRWYELEVK